MNMKIKKRVTASKDVKTNTHSEAVEYIESAIAALGSAAKSGDSVAKDSIANLAVILLDLKSN